MLVGRRKAGMNERRSFPRAGRGCLIEVAAAFLAVCVLLAVSASYRNFGDEFACQGGLGVGFPVSFLCDYGAGGSPIDNWGRVDLSDFPYFSLAGLLTDSLFYAAVLGTGWLVRRAFRHEDTYGVGNLLWVALVAIGFMAGFLSASAIFRADRVNFHDYLLGIPSPIPATATPLGNPPPPAETPVPTLGP
jgi:hypothetical protein